MRIHSEIQSTSLDTITGRYGDWIIFSCFSAEMLYLGVRDVGIIMCNVTKDGILRLITIHSLPSIEEGIYDYSGKLLLLNAGSEVYLWDRRKRINHFLFKKKAIDCIKPFEKWIFVARRFERRVEVYTERGRLVAAFETQIRPYQLFINSKYVFLHELDGKTRVYSNDCYFSLIKTLEGQAMHLDEQYLYCRENEQERERLSLINMSLERSSYVVVDQFRHIYGVRKLSNKILFVTESLLSLFEFKSRNKSWKLKWTSQARDYFPVDDGLFVLDTSKRYCVCLEVLPMMIRRILISF